MEYSVEEKKYLLNEQIGVQVDIQVRGVPFALYSLTFLPTYTLINCLYQEIHSGYHVTKTTGPADGRFTFTAHDPGDHSICISTNQTSSWFSKSHIRLYLDVIVGAARHDQDQDRRHAGQVSDRLRDLTDKLRSIRREQQYQREREAEFRNLSEATNSRAMWYMVVQLIVLITTCYLQLRHLRVRLPSGLSQGYGLTVYCSTSSQIGRQYRVGGNAWLTITCLLYNLGYLTSPCALVEQFSPSCFPLQ